MSKCSLPSISQGGSKHLPDDRSSTGHSSSNISTFFCNSCTQDLDVSVRKVNRKILLEYEEKYAQIRNIRRLLCEDETAIEYSNETHKGKDRTFNISDFSRETLQIYALGFPLIRQSRLLSPKTDEFNWEHIREKILKRQSRCQILNKAPHFRDGKKGVEGKYVQRKVRKLPSLSLQKVSLQAERYPLQTLISDPEVVVFDQFEIGGCYERRCKITNVSNEKCRFKIHSFDRNSQFKVNRDKPINSLAAGLSFFITIEFLCQSLADVEEELILTSKKGDYLIILIQAISDPPYLIESVDKTYNVDDVVDSLVDCGMHFVGQKSRTILTLKNVGNAGKFCFITETDWVSLEFNIDPSNVLIAEPFTIEPMLFVLNRDQEITISVSVVPPSNGLHTTRVFLLCNNGSVNPVDFVCDGLLFQPCSIDHLGMLKTFDVDIQDVVAADCYLDFGKMLLFNNKYLCFVLSNATGVNMHYHWELREVSVPGTEFLPVEALSIVPMSGCLNPQQVDMFCIKVDTHSVPPGIYRSLLVLVVDDLPNKSVPLIYCDKLLPPDQDDEKELRSIEAKYIEVWVECVSPIISLVPYIIDFSDFALVCGSPLETREIIIKNESPGALNLTWKYFEESSSVKLQINPSHLRCDEYCSNVCTLSIEAVQEGYFFVSLWCISENEGVKMELLVKGRCCKPRLTPLIDNIDLGLIKIGSNQNVGIVAKNCSNSNSFQWVLDEQYFWSPEEGLVTISEAPTSLSTNCGEFCHMDSEVLVNYQLNCQEDKLWCSTLEWDNHFIPVTADIQTPDVSLSSYTLVADPIFLNVMYRLLVTVRNHSLFSTAVFWGCPTDESQRAKVSVEVVPTCGVLEPEGRMVVEVRLTPCVIGSLENVYIPCFVEGNLHPLLLKIEGNVEGLRVRVEWDSSINQHCCVVWPRSSKLYSKESEQSLETIMCNCPPNSLLTSAISIDTNGNIVSKTSDISITLDMVNEASKASKTSGDFDEVDFIEPTMDEEGDNISLASSIPYLNWPIVGGRYSRDPMNEEWEDHFKNLFILEELGGEVDNEEFIDSSLVKNALCFHNIPVRKPITQNIYIRNNTAIPSFYEVSVVYNFERFQDSENKPDLDRILRKVRDDDYDEYVERASSLRGLTVFVKPASGQLLPDDYVIVSVTVVALSWGNYSDVIVLQIGELDHLCIQLSVSVTEPPVIAPQQMKFASVTPKGPPESRMLELKNLSTVPVYICWQMFTPSSYNLPFGVELFDGDPFELRLTDYYGSYSSPFFQIDETYTFLKPNSSKTVKLVCYPYQTRLDVRNNENIKILKALLVGHIYLTYDARLGTNDENCIRLDGQKLPPLKVNLEVQVEFPLLSLLNVFNYQLTFRCTAYDVLSTTRKIWNSDQVITVKNNYRTDLKAKVYTVGYFNLSKMEYNTCVEESRVFSKNIIFLRPGETCKVTVVCEVTEDAILDCFEEDLDGDDTESIELGTVEHGLLCFEQECFRQIVKLELCLYQPLLQFSENSLDFGPVYIEDTKTLIINITAPMNEESFEAFLKSETEGPFSINVNAGILKPNIAFLLQVFFAPKCCTIYQDSLVIRSCLKKMFRVIPLTGIGTFDYKTHTY